MDMDAPLADPAAMRHQAARLRSAAEQVSHLVERLDQRAMAMEFQGPAADRFRASMADRATRGRRVAHELTELSEHLQHSAARAEEQHAHRASGV
jgi:WXG100 family type VII secretion target